MHNPYASIVHRASESTIKAVMIGGKLYMEKSKPYVILSAAISVDGKLLLKQVIQNYLQNKIV